LPSQVLELPQKLIWIPFPHQLFYRSL
jgi:hypothetical protein